MTFQVSPPWICVTLTTAPSSGWVLRLAIVCRPPTICAAATTGSTPRCGIAACAPLPLDGDLEDVERGHHRPGPNRELAGGRPGQLCMPKTASTGIAREEAVLDHHPAAALVLLGRLEDEMQRCRRNCASRRGIARRRAASRYGRHGRRHASCPGASRHGRSRSSRGRAARPCRRAARSPGRRAASPAACRRRRCGRGRDRPRGRTIRAARRRSRRCGAPRRRSRDGRGYRAATPSSRRGNRQCG